MIVGSRPLRIRTFDKVNAHDGVNTARVWKYNTIMHKPWVLLTQIPAAQVLIGRLQFNLQYTVLDMPT